LILSQIPGIFAITMEQNEVSDTAQSLSLKAEGRGSVGIGSSEYYLRATEDI
jgi:hypothetical protein